MPRFVSHPALLICCFFFVVSGQVRRGRNEGTFNIPASNVIGNGNIMIAPAFSGGFAASGIRVDPGAYLAVGITDIMQLSGRINLTNFQTLGGTEGHFQITLPRNDHLRLFGIAIAGDLYLSTTMDTISGTASHGRPDYQAIIRPSLIADLDWIARDKKIPLKNYLLLGMADDPDELSRYLQLSLRFGTELKLNRNSYSLDIGVGLYRELKSERLQIAGDASFRQQRFWIEPAIRYRLFERLSLLGAARILILQRVKSERPLEPSYVRLSTALEIPLLYRETNTEAIRTMIFVEKSKGKQPDLFEASVRSGSVPETGLNLEAEHLDLIMPESESEQEVLQRREEIQKKMDQIEQLLEELK